MTDTSRRQGSLNFSLQAKHAWIASLEVPNDVKRLLWAVAKVGEERGENVVHEEDGDGGIEQLVEASKAEIAAAARRSPSTVKRWLAEAKNHPSVLTITPSQGGHRRAVTLFHVLWCRASEPGPNPVRTRFTGENGPGSEPGPDRVRTRSGPGPVDAPYTSYPRTRALKQPLEREGALKAPSLCLEEEPTTTPEEQKARLLEWAAERGEVPS